MTKTALMQVHQILQDVYVWQANISDEQYLSFNNNPVLQSEDDAHQDYRQWVNTVGIGVIARGMKQSMIELS